jgi:hypothetical protein
MRPGGEFWSKSIELGAQDVAVRTDDRQIYLADETDGLADHVVASAFCVLSLSSVELGVAMLFYESCGRVIYWLPPYVWQS